MMMGMMALWLLVPAAAVWLLRGQPQNEPKETANGALRTLEDRFARGEIDAEEFRTRRALIQGDPQ